MAISKQNTSSNAARDFYNLSKAEAKFNQRADDPGTTGYLYSNSNTKKQTP